LASWPGAKCCRPTMRSNLCHISLAMTQEHRRFAYARGVDSTPCSNTIGTAAAAAYGLGPVSEERPFGSVLSWSDFLQQSIIYSWVQLADWIGHPPSEHLLGSRLLLITSTQGNIISSHKYNKSVIIGWLRLNIFSHASCV
jgi:hypothetical protein